MSYQPKDNSGQIWKNDKKEQDTHPDFKGDCVIDGVAYWISAWKRSDGANPKAPPLKFSFKRKDAVHSQGVDQVRQAATQAKPQQKQSASADHNGFDELIPF